MKNCSAGSIVEAFTVVGDNTLQAPHKLQATGGFDVWRQHKDRHSRLLARGKASGMPGLSVAANCLEFRRFRDFTGGGSNRLAHAVQIAYSAGFYIGSEPGIALGFDRDRVHSCHSFDRVGTRSRFRRQHDRIGAVVDRRSNIRDFGTGWDGRAGHALQHLCRDDDRLADPSTFADQLALDGRNLLDWQLDAKIATRDHNAISGIQNLLETIDCSRLFDFCQNFGATAHQLLGIFDVCGPLDKGKCQPIHAQFTNEFKIGSILLG